MYRLVALLPLLVLAGCGDQQGPLEDVRIVSVTAEDECGDPDSYTIVEFPDRTRRFRFRTWGAVGDTFKARKVHAGANGWK